MGIIYLFENKINHKKYIGQTVNPDGRYRNHKSNYRNKKSSEYEAPLHRSMRKYGFDSFDYQILAKNIDDIDILNILEVYYIKKYDCQVPKGYNVEPGGKNCHKPKSPEQKKKLTWGQAELTEEEITELRRGYANKESPKKIYDEKYADRLHYASFLNIWSGRRYGNIMPEVLEKGRHTKMTQENADEIRRLYANGDISYQKLAEQFNVSKSTIADIIHNRTWNKKSEEPVSTIP